MTSWSGFCLHALQRLLLWLGRWNKLRALSVPESLLATPLVVKQILSSRCCRNGTVYSTQMNLWHFHGYLTTIQCWTACQLELTGDSSRWGCSDRTADSIQTNFRCFHEHRAAIQSTTAGEVQHFLRRCSYVSNSRTVLDICCISEQCSALLIQSTSKLSDR